MLEGLLAYNPKFRLTAKQCIDNEVFDDIRDSHLERDALLQINQSMFADGTFDYDVNVPIGSSIKDLKAILNKEIILIRNKEIKIK